MLDYTAPERGRVALLTVNAQRDFVDQGSPLKVCGANRALPAMTRLARGFRGAGVPLFHAVRLYRPDGSNVDNFRRKAVEEGMRVLMPGTFGAELIDDLRPNPGVRLDPDTLLARKFQQIGGKEWVHYKPRWGAFHDTTLEERLRELDISTVVLCGCNFATSGRATIYEAGARDFRVILATDALSGADQENLCEFGRIGIYLMNVENCLAWLATAPNRDAA